MQIILPPSSCLLVCLLSAGFCPPEVVCPGPQLPQSPAAATELQLAVKPAEMQHAVKVHVCVRRNGCCLAEPPVPVQGGFTVKPTFGLRKTPTYSRDLCATRTVHADPTRPSDVDPRASLEALSNRGSLCRTNCWPQSRAGPATQCSEGNSLGGCKDGLAAQADTVARCANVGVPVAAAEGQHRGHANEVRQLLTEQAAALAAADGCH